MKTHIIQLEPHDDIISIRDKMGWGQAARIVVVWPKGASILNRQLDLVLLQRHSASMGAQLALVTGDEEVRFHARQLNLPVFKSLKQAQRKRWRTGRQRSIPLERKAPRPDLRAEREQFRPAKPPESETTKNYRGVYIFGVLLIVAVSALLIPSVRVTIEPEIRPQVVTLDVTAGPGIEEINLSGALPVHQASVIVEGQDSLPTTRSVQIAEKQATGLVKFTNLTEKQVTIPQGTLIATTGSEPVRFSTTRSGVIPAGSGNTVNLPVKAVLPGKHSNVGIGELVAIEGPLGLSLTVTNPLPTSGGSNQSVPSPGQADFRLLREQLLEMLHEMALEEMEDSLGPDSFPIRSSLEISSTLVEIYDPPPGEGEPNPAEELSLTMQVEFRANYISSEDLHNLGEVVLNANLPEGFLSVPGSLEVQNLTLPQIMDESNIGWRIRVRQNIQTEIEQMEVVRMIRGKTAREAAAALVDRYDLAKTPTIQVNPEWWPRLPLLPFRVQLVQGEP